MAVTIDAVSTVVNFTTASSGTNATSTHVVSASATAILLLHEAGLDGITDANIGAFTTLTLGGKAFTHLGSALKHSGSDSDTAGYVDLWYMTATSLGSALPSGSSTLSVTETYTGAALKYCGGFFSVSVLGSDGATPTLITPKNGEFVSSLTLTGTGAAADLNLACCGNGTAAPGVTTGTSDASNTGSTNTGVHNLRVAHNAGNANIVFSTNSGDFSAATGAKFVASGGADPFPAGYQPAVIQQTVYRL